MNNKKNLIGLVTTVTDGNDNRTCIYLPPFYFNDPEGVKFINQTFDVEWKDLPLKQQSLTKQYLKGIREKNCSTVSFAIRHLKKLGLTEKIKNSRQIVPSSYRLTSEEIQTLERHVKVNYDELDMIDKEAAKCFIDLLKQKDFDGASIVKYRLENSVYIVNRVESKF